VDGLVPIAPRSQTKLPGGCRQEHYLPRPLTADQDRLIQQELLRRDDRNSNAFLLLRHTGMRIGECADLSFDCLRLVNHGWAIHVPLGKLKTERLVPVDSFVRQFGGSPPPVAFPRSPPGRRLSSVPPPRAQRAHRQAP